VDLTKFRVYDPALGRWWQVDPKTDDLASWTPYNYGFNNPVRFNDPMGDCPPGIDCGALLKGAWNSVVSTAKFVKETWNTGGDNIIQSVKNTAAFAELAYNAPASAKYGVGARCSL
jgi:uncharacterized protein RhaS with RHS repeats